MTHRRLGTSGLTTPPLILGGNVFGWTADRTTSFAILDAFVAGGGRMVDTADGYSSWVPGNSGGESETIIGEWLSARGRREDVLIATKVGAEVSGGRGLSPARVTATARCNRADISAQCCRWRGALSIALPTSRCRRSGRPAATRRR